MNTMEELLAAKGIFYVPGIGFTKLKQFKVKHSDAAFAMRFLFNTELDLRKLYREYYKDFLKQKNIISEFKLPDMRGMYPGGVS